MDGSQGLPRDYDDDADDDDEINAKGTQEVNTGTQESGVEGGGVGTDEGATTN